MRSVYNDEQIMDLETLMHEIGHNLGLQHSSQAGDSFSEEYGDISGYMGHSTSGTGNLNERKCFNGAKSFELGWYDGGTNSATGMNNRVATIDIMSQASYSGFLVGVDDYDTSTEDQILILQIASDSEPIYLAYNKAKGINAGTREAIDMVALTQVSDEQNSYLIATIAGDSSYIIEEFVNGLDLYIAVGEPNADVAGNDYVPISVNLEIDSCSSDDHCIVLPGMTTCSIGKCLSTSCSYTTPFTMGCCGDGYCDTSEHCSNCPADCGDSNCFALLRPSGPSYDYVDGNVYEITFQANALEDVRIYKIEFPVSLSNDVGPQAVDVYVGDSDAKYKADTYYDSSMSQYVQTVVLSTGQTQMLSSGSAIIFRIVAPIGSYLKFGLAPPTHTNGDLMVDDVFLKTSTGQTLNFSGIEMFGGTIHYTNLATQSPPPTPAPVSTPAPTPAPVSTPGPDPTPGVGGGENHINIFLIILAKMLSPASI